MLSPDRLGPWWTDNRAQRTKARFAAGQRPSTGTATAWHPGFLAAGDNSGLTTVGSQACPGGSPRPTGEAGPVLSDDCRVGGQATAGWQPGNGPRRVGQTGMTRSGRPARTRSWQRRCAPPYSLGSRTTVPHLIASYQVRVLTGPEACALSAVRHAELRNREVGPGDSRGRTDRTECREATRPPAQRNSGGSLGCVSGRSVAGLGLQLGRPGNRRSAGPILGSAAKRLSIVNARPPVPAAPGPADGDETEAAYHARLGHRSARSRRGRRNRRIWLAASPRGASRMPGRGPADHHQRP